jgi:hypothetical protein
MKEVKVDARLAVAAVALGSLGSGLLGYALARSRARRAYAVRLDKAVAEVKAHYSRPIFSKVDEDGEIVKLVPNRTTWTDVVKQTFEVKAVRDPLEGIGDGSVDGDAADEDSGDGRAGAESEGSGGLPAVAVGTDLAVEGDDENPFVISEAQFGELNEEGFQTISVTYYAADKVLVDDQDQPIRDMLGTVGTLNPLGFGGISDDPHIRYVRNRRLEVDFEILLDARSYTDTVLGYGSPNRQREANPAATAT